MESLKLLGPLVLGFMMLGMGLELRGRDFFCVFAKPRALLSGLIAQIFFLPLLYVAVLKVLELEPNLLLGFLLLSVSPGGPGSNLLCYLCGLNVALSLSLTAASSLIAFVSIPLILPILFEVFALETAVQVKTPLLSLAVFTITIVPTLVGVLMNHFCSDVAFRLARIMKKISVVLLLALVFSVFLKERVLLGEHFLSLGLSQFLILLGSLLMALLWTYVLRLERLDAMTVSVEVAIQNSALAIVLAVGLFESHAASVPAALYSPVMLAFASSLLLVKYFLRDAKKKAKDSKVFRLQN